MPFRIERNDITKISCDAIVNTANPRPIIGDGTDTAIYRAAGEERLGRHALFFDWAGLNPSGAKASKQ